MINACRTVIHCKLELAVLCGSNVRLGSQLRADSETRYFSPLTSSIEGSSESPHRISNFNFQNIVPPNSSFRLTAHVEDHQEAYAESASAVHFTLCASARRVARAQRSGSLLYPRYYSQTIWYTSSCCVWWWRYIHGIDSWRVTSMTTPSEESRIRTTIVVRTCLTRMSSLQDHWFTFWRRDQRQINMYTLNGTTRQPCG